MEELHTKGDWYVDENSLGTRLKVRSDIHKNGQGICLINPCKEQKANARLIACAPELLTGLQSTIKLLKEYNIIKQNNTIYDCIVEYATKID